MREGALNYTLILCPQQGNEHKDLVSLSVILQAHGRPSPLKLKQPLTSTARQNEGPQSATHRHPPTGGSQGTEGPRSSPGQKPHKGLGFRVRLYNGNTEFYKSKPPSFTLKKMTFHTEFPAQPLDYSG